MNQRGRTVALAIHLVQAARLETGWHQETIRARLDQVSQFFIKTDTYRNGSRTIFRNPREFLLQYCVTAAENRQLCGYLSYLRRYFHQQIITFLMGKPAHGAK